MTQLQKKKTSAIEVLSNIAVGMCVSYLLQLLMLPELSNGRQLSVLAVFTVASFVRGYFMRRVFNYLTKRGIK